MEANPLEPSDAQLVEATLRGEHSAFDELVLRYRSRTFYLVLSKLGSREAALDVTQEAFVQAYLSLAALREPDKFAGWLGGIACHACGTYLRKARELPVPMETLEVLSGSQSRTDDCELDAAVARTELQRLPNGTRTVATLFFIEEMKQSEIAEFLGISLAAVKSRIRDARASLQKEMIHMVKQTSKKQEPGVEFGKSLKHRLELARWYRELSEMIDAGNTIMRALDTLRQGDYSPSITQDTARMMDAILHEATLSEALEACPALQTPEAKHLILAGEYGGMLELTTSALVDYMQLRSIQESLEIAILCRTIGGLVLGRNELTMALHHSAEVAQNDLVRQVTRKMLESLDSGGTLTAAVAQYAGALPTAMVTAVRAGEQSGTLGYALCWAAEQIAGEASRLLMAPRRDRPAWMEQNVYEAMKQAFDTALSNAEPCQ